MGQDKDGAEVLGVNVLEGRRIVKADAKSGHIEDDTGAVYKLSGSLTLVQKPERTTNRPPKYVNSRTPGQSAYHVMLDGKLIPWWVEADVDGGWVTHYEQEPKSSRLVLDASGARKVFRSEGKVAILATPPQAGLGPEGAMR